MTMSQGMQTDMQTDVGAIMYPEPYSSFVNNFEQYYSL